MKSMLPLFFLLFSETSSALSEVCPHIFMREGKLRLDANQRVLVCGKDEALPSWQKVPLSQAQYMLNVILQNKGYFNAKFERSGDKLFVERGVLTRIKSLELRGDRRLLDPD